MTVYRTPGETASPCPSCAKPLVEAGKVARCSGCEGVWVEERALATMFAELSGGAVTGVPLALPSVFTKLPDARPCAVCGKPMLVRTIGKVVVDQCEAHGIWFDREEMEEALRHRPAVDEGAPPPEGAARAESAPAAVAKGVFGSILEAILFK